jgi:lauroyl/myristoyl acyltransferase
MDETTRDPTPQTATKATSASVASAARARGVRARLTGRLAQMPNPLAGGMAKYYAFRAAAAIAPRLPAALVYRTAALVGALFWMVAPKLRAQAERNLRHVPTLAADPQALRRAVRGVFHYTVLNYLDFLCDAHLSDEQIWRRCGADNEDVFDALVAEGHGMVLLVPHSSAFELAAARLAVKGVQVVIPVERMHPEALFAFFRQSRERLGVRFLPADSRETLHEMMKVLRSGGVLVFAVDRLVTGASVALPLFGEPAKMPITPAGLALRLGAHVTAAFPYRLTPDTAHIHVVPLTREEGGGATEIGDAPRAGQAARATGGAEVEGRAQGKPGKAEGAAEAGARLQRRFVAELERFLIAHPEQWISALSPVWEA